MAAAELPTIHAGRRATHSLTRSSKCAGRERPERAVSPTLERDADTLCFVVKDAGSGMEAPCSRERVSRFHHEGPRPRSQARSLSDAPSPSQAASCVESEPGRAHWPCSGFRFEATRA
jgi:hypothetical protein